MKQCILSSCGQFSGRELTCACWFHLLVAMASLKFQFQVKTLLNGPQLYWSPFLYLSVHQWSLQLKPPPFIKVIFWYDNDGYVVGIDSYNWDKSTKFIKLLGAINLSRHIPTSPWFKVIFLYDNDGYVVAIDSYDWDKSRKFIKQGSWNLLHSHKTVPYDETVRS